MFKKVVLILATLIVLSVPVYSNNIIDLTNSVVMIDNDYTCFGTAFTIDENEDYYYFLTAGHTIDCIVNMKKSPNCKDNCLVKRQVPLDLNIHKIDITLYHTGIDKRYENVVEVLGYHFKPNTSNDAALFRVKKNDIKDYKSLNILKLGDDLNDTIPGKVIWTYGNAEAGWPTVYKGRIISDKSKNITFYPPAISGRSGSPLLNYDGSKVIGMIITTTMNIDENGIKTKIKSNAIPTWRLREFVNVYNNIITKDVDNE